MTWSAKRQTMILGTILVVFFVVLTISYELFWKSVPSCIDNIQNQGELGVDCGGPCATVCPNETADLTVFWSRAFKVNDGAYDVAALVENPNLSFGIKNLSYVFKVYDKDNLLITEKSGSTFVNPKERFVIFEPKLEVGRREPKRATIEFGQLNWSRVAEANAPAQFNLQNKIFTPSPSPYLTAELSNVSSYDASGIEVYAIVYDGDGNAMGVSSTFIDSLRKNLTDKLTFTWPEPFAGTSTSIDILYRVNTQSAQ